jgi:hypothetical protein
VPCGKTVTREPGGPWYDFYGRDRCRLDPEDGQCDVPAWHSIELPQSPPLQLSTVTLFGRDAEGKVVELVRQTLPAGAGWSEQFPEPLEVLGWSIEPPTIPD